jgi:hypothetical protein
MHEWVVFIRTGRCAVDLGAKGILQSTLLSSFVWLGLLSLAFETCVHMCSKRTYLLTSMASSATRQKLTAARLKGGYNTQRPVG